MKKKIYLAVLATCMMLAWNGCGNDKETAKNDTAAEQTEQDSDTAASDETGSTRLVSVDNVEKYVTIADYKGIALDRSVAEVTDEDVENRVAQNLQDKSEEVTAEDAVIQNGDTATINFVGTKDGVAFEGGTANNYDLVIGSGTMIPGFEEGIVGMKKGETKDITVTFPENYQSSELAGKEAVFQITVQSFKRPPELTDAWVAANTDYKTADEYRASVRTQLEQEAQDQADSSLRSTAWTTVYSNSEVVEYPEKDIEEATQEFRSQIEAYAKQGDMELEDFVESQGISMDDFEAQCQQYAQEKVKQNLIIQGIMDAEGMTLEDEESLAIQNELVDKYASGDLAALIDTYGQAAVDETIGLRRVEDFIIANSKEPETEDTAGESETGSAENTESADSVSDTDSTDSTGTAADASAENADTGADSAADANTADTGSNEADGGSETADSTSQDGSQEGAD